MWQGNATVWTWMSHWQQQRYRDQSNVQIPFGKKSIHLTQMYLLLLIFYRYRKSPFAKAVSPSSREFVFSVNRVLWWPFWGSLSLTRVSSASVWTVWTHLQQNKLPWVRHHFWKPFSGLHACPTISSRHLVKCLCASCPGSPTHSLLYRVHIRSSVSGQGSCSVAQLQLLPVVVLHLTSATSPSWTQSVTCLKISEHWTFPVSCVKRPIRDPLSCVPKTCICLLFQLHCCGAVLNGHYRGPGAYMLCLWCFSCPALLSLHDWPTFPWPLVVLSPFMVSPL